MTEPFDPNDPKAALEAEIARRKKQVNGNGAVDSWSSPSPAQVWPEPLGPAAYHGITGDFVRLVEPNTESDPAALILQFLAAAGNCFGDKAWFVVEETRHYPNLFAVIAGDTSKARKGTSWRWVHRVFKEADAHWEAECTTSGLSTGEGLIERVRDPVIETNEKTGASEVVSPGVSDKRLFVHEEEFSRPIRAMNRAENTLASVLQQAWDGNRLGIMTRKNPVKATGATISVVAQTTIEQLCEELSELNAVNGFANRFLFVVVKRSKLLPFGGSIDAAALSKIADSLRDALQYGPGGLIRFDEVARRRWIEIYPQLSAAMPGLYGAVVARSEAQAVRIALLYALLDQQSQIGIAHLEAALEIVRYANNSAQHIFGDATGNRVADTILRALRATDRMTRTEINYGLFDRNVKADEISRALALLFRMGKIRRAPSASTGGRPPEAWGAI